MDLHALTTTSELTADTVLREAQRMLDAAAVWDLGALYVMAVDDPDLDPVSDCFAPDGTFTRGGATTRGHDQLRTLYIGMMDRYITTLHPPYSHVVAMSGPDTATSLVTAHAVTTRHADDGGQPLLRSSCASHRSKRWRPRSPVPIGSAGWSCGTPRPTSRRATRRGSPAATA